MTTVDRMREGVCRTCERTHTYDVRKSLSGDTCTACVRAYLSGAPIPYASIAHERLDALASLASRSLTIASKIVEAAKLIGDSIEHGGKVLVVGNGGSAAQAQHFAAELVGRYRKERRALPAIALTTDTSALTALVNDYDPSTVFSRQVEALAKPGDVLVALSTSGKSVNVIRAANAADQLKCKRIGITGQGAVSENWFMCDVWIEIPSEDTALVQEITTSVIHSLAHIVEERFA